MLLEVKVTESISPVGGLATVVHVVPSVVLMMVPETPTATPLVDDPGLNATERRIFVVGDESAFQLEPPFVDFKIVPMNDNQFALTPYISYGEVADGELAIKDRSQEQELTRELRQNKQLSMNQTVYLSARDLFTKRELSPGVRKFSEIFFTGSAVRS